MFFDKEKFENVILNAESILIVSHTSPDADAVCSAQLLKLMLQNRFNKESSICISGGVGKLVMPFSIGLSTSENLNQYYDLVFCLDSSNLNLVGDMKAYFEKAKYTINIDHHNTNNLFAQINMVDSKATSTCEILYGLCMEHYSDIITPDIAMHAYAGIITDTNALLANDIGAKTYHILAHIMSQGIDTDSIKNYFFKSYSKARLLLLTKIYNTIKFYHGGKIALTILSNEDIKRAGATNDDTLGIVDQTLCFDTVDIAIIIIETLPNYYHVSLRSKIANVSTIAKKLGGGGHKHMAAFQHKGTVADFKDYLISVCEEYLNSPLKD